MSTLQEIDELIRRGEMQHRETDRRLAVVEKARERQDAAFSALELALSDKAGPEEIAQAEKDFDVASRAVWAALDDSRFATERGALAVESLKVALHWS